MSTCDGEVKRGLVAARDALRSESSVTPFDVYRAIDLGPGGCARAPARQAKRAVRDRGDFAAYRAWIGRTSKQFTIVG